MYFDHGAAECHILLRRGKAAILLNQLFIIHNYQKIVNNKLVRNIQGFLSNPVCAQSFYSLRLVAVCDGREAVD